MAGIGALWNPGICLSTRHSDYSLKTSVILLSVKVISESLLRVVCITVSKKSEHTIEFNNA
jgi:hypothetical protein